jgi:Nucleoside-diphosphate-sugar epimerases
MVDNEKELVIPAIQGVRSILEASAKSSVKRIVMISSFGAVLDMGKNMDIPYTYSPEDWNPITYSEAIDPLTTSQDAYRGSKVFAEQEAWKFVHERKPHFDLVTLCPSMVFGPVTGRLESPRGLNESNAVLWKVASGGPSQSLPPARFNFWIDVRDLAEIHVQALLSPQAGGKRYIPVAPEKFTYQLASKIIVDEFPERTVCVSTGSQEIKNHINVDMDTMKKDFPDIKYRTFRQTVIDFVRQVSSLENVYDS